MESHTPDAHTVFVELQAVVTRQLGDRAGTFKVAAVDEQLSIARQHARSLLSDDQRAVVDAALAEFRSWIIDRDEEAAERVRGGGHPPQDIAVAVRVAEDTAIAIVVGELEPGHDAALRSRLAAVTVETVEERTLSARPELKFNDTNVHLMILGLVIMFAMSALGSLSTVLSLGGIIVGAAAFVTGVRRWRSGETVSNVTSVSQFKGGSMGRKRNL
jgi:hypothetical protein